MSKHSGEHPRFGATDVCPLVPVSGVTMAEATDYARALAKRLGEELGLTIYCYENAAFSEERRNLANVRAGEYEGLEAKLKDPIWKPDFGPAEFNARSGATAVSARDFLVAYNINLNTTSTRRANAIAFDVREQGRIKTEDGKPGGKKVLDANGEPVRIPGTLKCVKGIGWYIEEYGVAQISMNLTNTSVTPVHVAFDEVCRCAQERGVRVTGSELVGLVPLAIDPRRGPLLPAQAAALGRRLRSRTDQHRREIDGARRTGALRPGREDHRVRDRGQVEAAPRRHDPSRLHRGNAVRVARTGWWVGFRRVGRARRIPRCDGRQPQLAQARLGRPLGGILGVGGAGQGSAGSTRRARRCGHRGVQRDSGGFSVAAGQRRGEGGACRRDRGGQPRCDRGAVARHGGSPSSRWRSCARWPRAA